MDFEIPEELKMLQSLVRDFVNDQLKPMERDLLGRASDLSDARISPPPEAEKNLIRIAKDIGLWGINVPEEFGGASMGTLCSCLVEEELAQTIVPFNFGDVTPFLFDGNDEQKEKYLLPVMERQKYAYVALLEPKKGTELTEIKMKAAKRDGHYILNGEKVSFSRIGQDYFAIVFALTTEKNAKDGVTCFLVDKDTAGFTVTGGGEATGWQARVTEPLLLTFRKCRVSAENVLGQAGKAFNLGKTQLPARRIIRASRCVGTAIRLLEEAATQVQNWQTFGQNISTRPDVQAALADTAASIHACRLMVYQAAGKTDRGEAVRQEASLVKLYATTMLHSVADSITHVFSGPPYLSGLPMERLCRHALAEIAVASSLALQRNVIAREVLKGWKV